MKKRYSRTLLIATAALAATSTQALANPNGGSVVAGQATIAQTAPAQVTITQSTDKAIINWNSFSIGAGEKTRFVQPSSNSITLNRVTGPDVSQILGQLTANGRIVLVNPNGVFFGKDSQVDVAALIATSHDIKNDDFMAGKLNFTIPGKPGAQIINQGKITVQEGGLVALVAPSVQNSGLIIARLGKVALASANSFTIDLYGDNLILFEADSAITSQLKDALGNPLATAVENSGTIEANGGWVLLTAEVAKNVVDKAINMTGHIKATTVDQQEGTIILKAMGGEVAVAGTLDASAPNGGDGGFIETSGAHVSIDPGTQITTASIFGNAGHWLIDPTDYIIGSGGDITSAALVNYLNYTNIEIQTAPTGVEHGDIYVNDNVTWTSLSKLTLSAQRNIYINRTINASGNGSMLLRADNTGTGLGTVVFGSSGYINMGWGSLGIYYNPASYASVATKSDNTGNPYSSKLNFLHWDPARAPYAYMLVNNVSQLQAMNTNLAGHYALSKDIDASATAGWNGGAGFVPVGTNWPNHFSGIFDGKGHVINNLFIYRPAYLSPVGLFGWVEQGIIRNVGVQGGNISGYQCVGGLAGYLANLSNIYNTYSTANVTGVYAVGGLVGETVASPTSLSYASGNVTGDSQVGGLVGVIFMPDGSVSDSYATGNVTGNSSVGGLVGATRMGGRVVHSYATGHVTGTLEVGGLVGAGGDTPDYYNNGNWNIETSGQVTSYGGTGLTTAQMKQQANYWDFTYVWTIQNGVSYPTLRASTVPGSFPLQPGVLPVVNLLQLFNKYNGVSAVTLLNGILAGDLRNDPTNPVWHALYQNGTATSAQIEANRLWNIYDDYKSANAQTLVLAVQNGIFSTNSTDPVWNALACNPNRQSAIQLLQDIENAKTTPDTTDGGTGGGTTSGGNPSGGQWIPGQVIAPRDYQMFFNSDTAQLGASGISIAGGDVPVIKISGYAFDALSVIEYLYTKDYTNAAAKTEEVVAAAIIPYFGALKATSDASKWLANKLDSMLTEQGYCAVVGLLSANHASGEKPFFTQIQAMEFAQNSGFLGGANALNTIGEMVNAGLLETKVSGGEKHYSLTVKGALSIYGTLVPPTKTGWGGLWGNATYEGVTHDTTLMGQLASALTPAS